MSAPPAAWKVGEVAELAVVSRGAHQRTPAEVLSVSAGRASVRVIDARTGEKKVISVALRRLHRTQVQGAKR